MKFILKNLFREAAPDVAASADDERMAIAQLLIEIARADASTADVEMQVIRRYLQRAYDLDAAALEALMHKAGERVERAVSLYETVTLLNRALDAEGKRELIRALWQVAFADGKLDRYEEAMLRRLAELLYIPHATFIGTKLAVSGG